MKWLQPTDICVVTGGSNGLGAEILKAFAMQGCQTVSLDTCSGKLDNEREFASSLDLTEPGTSNGIIGREKSLAATTSEPTSARCEKVHLLCEAESTTTHDEPVNSSGVSTNTEEDIRADFNPTLSINCDVRNRDDLKKARDCIYKKFERYPSVIVLNAGVRKELHSIAESDFDDLQDTIDVNLGGVIKGCRTFLPDIIENKRGFIVTIASALGILVPKGLGAYGASKAGIIGLHEALEQEISELNDVHALLVCPGQLDTKMFSDVRTPSNFLAPIVPPAKLAEKIVKRVAKAKTCVIYAPAYVRYLPFIHSIPVPLARIIRKFSGVDEVFDKVAKERIENAHRQDVQQEFSDQDNSCYMNNGSLVPILNDSL